MIFINNKSFKVVYDVKFINVLSEIWSFYVRLLFVINIMGKKSQSKVRVMVKSLLNIIITFYESKVIKINETSYYLRWSYRHVNVSGFKGWKLIFVIIIIDVEVIDRDILVVLLLLFCTLPFIFHTSVWRSLISVDHRLKVLVVT